MVHFLSKRSLIAGLLHLDFEGERTERSYHLYEDLLNDLPFDRNSVATTISIQFMEANYQPKIGLRYFSLKEEGYFGRSSDQTGKVDRRESFVFVEGRYLLSQRHSLRPALYLGNGMIEQAFSKETWRSKEQNEFIGKFVLPWIIAVNDKGAHVTFSSGFDLHDQGFGGGNIQVHWPM